MKMDSDNFRESAIQGVLKRITDAGVQVVIFEPAIEEAEFLGAKVVNDFEQFVSKSDVIVANRLSPEMEKIDPGKIYTRDLYSKD
ncbi:UDP-glucose 6-dehydrogenase [compost metagenome]